MIARHRSSRVGREPVIRIWPLGSKPGIAAGLADTFGELRELVAAALTHGRERHRVPREPQRDLVRLASPVAAVNCLDGQHRAINTA